MGRKPTFYSLKNIMEYDAHYNMIIGERSNGKTYAALKYALEQYAKDGSEFAYLRRMTEDFRGKRGQAVFAALEANNEIYKITRGEWCGVHYWSGRFYLCNYDENGKRVPSDTPFGYAFSIASMEHDKSTSYPNITTVIFDEFLTRGYYLPDEFIQFTNCLSTIIRHRNNVKIFMLANTVSKYAPYFREMGLSHVKDMKQGTIDLYTYGSDEDCLKVAVEYCEASKHSKPSDVYFSFDNPKLKMVTSGVWELAIYPHCPVKYLPKHIAFTYFIEFEGELLQCEIVNHPTGAFTFIHQKTTPLQNPDRDFVYSTRQDNRPNWRMQITAPQLPIEKKIIQFFRENKVFYQDNEIGEIVRNYLMWSNQYSHIRK